MSNSYKTLNQVRASFIDFFKSKGHEVVQSSPLVPHNDPTLMFTNAGMVPFKNVFAGREEIKSANGDVASTVTSSQKCVRAGGKHNDLDNVGYTARHHTFFEMLGNFSFGDYFKEQAILHAWEYLTEVLKLPKEKLVVTVYHTDDEAFDLWKKISGLPEDKIIRIATNDNFWAMGDTGPCGPCSEIFYDHGEHVEGGLPGTPEEDGDRYIEIWNLVFMQFEKLEDGTQIDLPNPCIDTGMGLERITTIMQNVKDNFDIDLFKNLIAASKEITGNSNPKRDFSHRIIADHLRSTSFLIADGVLPSNEGRGYVLRRIMRRAMRHCHNLDNQNTVMHRLVPALIEEMGEAYPELVRAESLITQTLEQEETKFRETLGKGLKLLKEELKSVPKDGELDGKVAFKLYDTYGFPYDLTQDILRESDRSVDDAAFKAAMEEQKNKARSSWSGSGEQAEDGLWLELYKVKGATEFIGYETLDGRGNITAIVKGKEQTDSIKTGDEAFIITNQTPFYAESGGQAGDIGKIITDDGAFEVKDVKKFAGAIHAHYGVVTEGVIKADSEMVKMEVCSERRAGVKRAHSATHILHAVLKDILGDFVTQKGSLVEDDYLRFDFSCPNSISAEQYNEIELKANSIIMGNSSTQTRVMPVQQAMDLGATALFGEKYGDEVRVVAMGDENYSMEFCGGTHVDNTGDVGFVKIFNDSAVSAGVRRIEAYTGGKALEYAMNIESKLNEIQKTVKTSADDLLPRITKLLSEKKEMEKEISELKKQLALSGGAQSGNGGSEVEEINGVNFVGKFLPGVATKDLRGLVDEYKSKYDNAIILLISENDGKAGISAGLSSNLTDKYNAVDLVRKSSEILGGKGGGGRPDFAQGGAPSATNAQQALDEAKKFI